MLRKRNHLKFGAQVVLRAVLATFVLLSASAGVCAETATVPVPVPAVPIQPGDVIREDQIVTKEFDARIALRSFYRDESVIGKVSRRTLSPGRPIPFAAVKEAFLVFAGDLVTVRYSADNLELSGRALALQSGRRGEFVACRNVQSGTVIRGIVADKSLVQLDAN